MFPIKLQRFIKILFLICLLYWIFFKVLNREYSKKIVLWWTPFMPKYDRLIKCNPDGEECILSSKREYINHPKLAAILFYGSQISNFDFPLPRNEQLPWAIFHEESPKNYAPFLFQGTQDLFNITSTFSKHSDFPVTLQYLKSFHQLIDKTYYIPLSTKNALLEHIAPVLYVQSDCDTPLGRDFLVSELSKYIKIDSYGRCLKNKEFPNSLSTLYPLDLYNEKYMQFIARYKFIISFENAKCEDYITEKIWRPLIVGSIPVYLGASNIEDWLPNKQSAILAKHFKDMKTLANYINEVNQIDTLYESYLTHKILGTIENKDLRQTYNTEHPIPEFECYICKKIHKNEEYKPKNINVYNCPKPKPNKNEKNTWDQHWDIGKCQSKALTVLIENNEPYTETTFENTWKEFYNNNDC